MRTRFQGGLVADIQPPDLEMRMAILQTKALNQNQHVDDEVLSLIANKVKSNIREMEGLLYKGDKLCSSDKPFRQRPRGCGGRAERLRRRQARRR